MSLKILNNEQLLYCQISKTKLDSLNFEWNRWDLVQWIIIIIIIIIFHS